LAITGHKRSFDEPIPLACGRYLVTLDDAGARDLGKSAGPAAARINESRC
jgi:hypothetical protein